MSILKRGQRIKITKSTKTNWRPTVGSEGFVGNAYLFVKQCAMIVEAFFYYYEGYPSVNRCERKLFIVDVTPNQSTKKHIINDLMYSLMERPLDDCVVSLNRPGQILLDNEMLSTKVTAHTLLTPAIVSKVNKFDRAIITKNDLRLAKLINKTNLPTFEIQLLKLRNPLASSIGELKAWLSAHDEYLTNANFWRSSSSKLDDYMRKIGFADFEDRFSSVDTEKLLNNITMLKNTMFKIKMLEAYNITAEIHNIKLAKSRAPALSTSHKKELYNIYLDSGPLGALSLLGSISDRQLFLETLYLPFMSGISKITQQAALIIGRSYLEINAGYYNESHCKQLAGLIVRDLATCQSSINFNEILYKTQYLS